VAHVGDDADDLAGRRVLAPLDDDRPAHRLAVRPEPAGRGLVENDDRRRALEVVGGEPPSVDEGDA
jgi:hypothetical protein